MSARATNAEQAAEIIRLAEEIARHVETRGLVKSDFEQLPDDIHREDAVGNMIFKIERLLEESKELFNSQQHLLDAVDLEGVSKMHDKNIHHYEDGNEEEFWYFYEEHLPTIVDACQRYLSSF